MRIGQRINNWINRQTGSDVAVGTLSILGIAFVAAFLVGMAVIW